MKNILKYRMTLILCLASISYGFYYIFPRTGEVLFLQPPEIFFVSWLLIISSISTLIAVYFNLRKIHGYFLILIAMTWTIVSWRYIITPLPSSSSILSLGYVLIALATLLRGNYDDDWEG